ERVGEIHETDDAHGPRQRDPEPGPRPKRRERRESQHRGEGRAERGGYREGLRERRPHERRCEETETDVAEGLHHKERLQRGLARKACQTRCDVPPRQQADRDKGQDDLRREDEVGRHVPALYARSVKGLTHRPHLWYKSRRMRITRNPGETGSSGSQVSASYV